MVGVVVGVTTLTACPISLLSTFATCTHGLSRAVVVSPVVSPVGSPGVVVVVVVVVVVDDDDVAVAVAAVAAVAVSSPVPTRPAGSIRCLFPLSVCLHSFNARMISTIWCG